jgi:hypothetical protein
MTKAVDSMHRDVATRAAVALPPRQAAALSLDWDRGDLDDLRRMMSRMDVDLETAVQVFFNGAPARYNLIAKSDLLPQAQARCNLLDSIHRRIACGFYLPDPARGLGGARARMQDWIAGQRRDAAAGRSGRWVFDSALLDMPLPDAARAVIATPKAPPVALDSLWQRLARMIWRHRQVKPPCELER